MPTGSPARRSATVGRATTPVPGPSSTESRRRTSPPSRPTGYRWASWSTSRSKWFLCSADLDEDPLAAPDGPRLPPVGPPDRPWRRRRARRLEPDVVLLCNGLFLFEAITWALCRQRGIDVVTYERAFLKETLVFHRGEPAGLLRPQRRRGHRSDRALTASEEHVLDDYLDRRRHGQAFDQFWEFRQGAIERAPGTDGQSSSPTSPGTRRSSDRDMAFPDIQDWIAAAIETFAARPDHRLVIRVHPSEAAPAGQAHPGLARRLRRRALARPCRRTSRLVGSDDLRELLPADGRGRRRAGVHVDDRARDGVGRASPSSSPARPTTGARASPSTSRRPTSSAPLSTRPSTTPRPCAGRRPGPAVRALLLLPGSDRRSVRRRAAPGTGPAHHRGPRRPRTRVRAPLWTGSVEASSKGRRSSSDLL